MKRSFQFAARSAGNIKVKIEDCADFENLAGVSVRELLPLLTADLHTLSLIVIERDTDPNNPYVWYMAFDPHLYPGGSEKTTDSAGNVVSFHLHPDARWAEYEEFFPLTQFQGDGAVFLRNVIIASRKMDLPALSLRSSMDEAAYFYLRAGARPVNDKHGGFQDKRAVRQTKEDMRFALEQESDELPPELYKRLSKRIDLIVPSTFKQNPAFLQSIVGERHPCGNRTIGYKLAEFCDGPKLFELQNDRHMLPVMEYLQSRAELSIARTPRVLTSKDAHHAKPEAGQS